jgi:hypothetical protein
MDAPRVELGCCTVARPVRLSNEGVVVPRVVITHAVEDVDRWLQGKAGRAAAIESGTGSNVTDYVAADGSKNVAITADVSDPATLQGMLASPPPEVLAAMQEHGVVQPITAYVEREVTSPARSRWPGRASLGGRALCLVPNESVPVAANGLPRRHS